MGCPSRAMRQDDGFTLLELMVTALIIAILLAIAVIAYASTTRSANAATCAQNCKALNTALEVAMCTVGTDQPDEIEDLRPFVNSFDRVKVCPLDGTPLLFDAEHNRVICVNHP